jgi:hypothetical protein
VTNAVRDDDGEQDYSEQDLAHFESTPTGLSSRFLDQEFGRVGQYVATRLPGWCHPHLFSLVIVNL